MSENQSQSELFNFELFIINSYWLEYDELFS